MKSCFLHSFSQKMMAAFDGPFPLPKFALISYAECSLLLNFVLFATFRWTTSSLSYLCIYLLHTWRSSRIVLKLKSDVLNPNSNQLSYFLFIRAKKVITTFAGQLCSISHRISGAPTYETCQLRQKDHKEFHFIFFFASTCWLAKSAHYAETKRTSFLCLDLEYPLSCNRAVEESHFNGYMYKVEDGRKKMYSHYLFTRSKYLWIYCTGRCSEVRKRKAKDESCADYI